MKNSDPSFKKSRATWLRDIERSNVNRLRTELKTLIGKCKVARLRRRAAISSAKEECAEHVTTTRAAFNKALSKCGSRRACAPTRSARHAATTSARSACANMKADARAPYDARLESLYAKRESVAEDIRNRSKPRTAKPSTKLSALEKRSEDNESVERDIAAIDPMLVGIWRKHSRQFKKSEHASRYEKFPGLFTMLSGAYGAHFGT